MRGLDMTRRSTSIITYNCLTCYIDELWIAQRHSDLQYRRCNTMRINHKLIKGNCKIVEREVKLSAIKDI